MTQLNLPAHLAGRQRRNLAETAAVGIGSLLPPHISIRGNTFTLIDAAGHEQAAGATLDCVIIDTNGEFNCKKYFPDKWEPDSKDPPTCWSANGVAPSREAITPQARACADCPHNVRGSRISEMSGASIKACRDEKWLALLIPSVPGMLFQMVLTPGSFGNWKVYLEKFKNNGLDLDFVITRMSFVPKVNGVLAFDAPGFVGAELVPLIDAALAEKKTDVLVGRNDVPRDPALMAPASQSVVPLSLPTGQMPSAVFAQPAIAAAPAEQTPPTDGRRKKRNTAAAETPTPATQAPFQANTSTPAPIQAPFATAPAPQANGSFGMAAGAEPNAELQNVLKSVFG